MELHLYDFDGTLFRSPDRPEGWGPKSWVLSPLSLGPPCVPQMPGNEWWVPSVVADAKRSIADPEVWAIVCTGRPNTGGLRFRIAELLKGKGLSFDQVFLNTGGDTKAFKLRVIQALLRKHPGILAVHIWENNLLDMGAFCKAVEATGRLCVRHPVKVPAQAPQCSLDDLDALEAEGWSRYAVRRVAHQWLTGRVTLEDR